MAYHRLVIGSTGYVLADSETRASVAASIVDAVRAGGDFIHVPLNGHALDVLITPATPVVIELVEPGESRPTGYIDFDLDWIDFDSPA